MEYDMRDSFRPSRGGALIWDGTKYVQETEDTETEPKTEDED